MNRTTHATQDSQAVETGWLRLADIESFRQWSAELSQAWDESQPCVKVCDGTGCRALGSQKVLSGLRTACQKADLPIPLEIVGTGCPGFCECGPLLTIYPQKISYQKIKPNDVKEIVERTLVGGEIIERLLYTDPLTGEHIHREPDLPFYSKQLRQVLDFNGRIDPTRIEEYVALGGYQSLVKALSLMEPEQVIAEVKAAGLRGRGGAGFSTGLKWEIARQNIRRAAGAGYIICNADEGDPGAFMDRSVMEGNPHSVIEGMVIGAYAISNTLQISQTTWISPELGLTWALAGANDVTLDRRPVPESTVTTTGPLLWYRFDVKNLTQEWLDASTANNGVLLRCESCVGRARPIRPPVAPPDESAAEGPPPTNGIFLLPFQGNLCPFTFFFASGEYSDPTLGPRLVVRYQ